MVGIRCYLRKPMHLTHGHITFIDSPWALTALNQGQFWKDRVIARDYGDGNVVDILSRRRLQLGYAGQVQPQAGEALQPG